MATIQNVELIDDVRKDALILMKSRPNISYLEAYALARNNLIGEGKITDFKFKPFSVAIDLDGKEEVVEDTSNILDDDASTSFFQDYAKKELSGVMKIADYNPEQIKSYVIAHKMGVDVSKFASELYSPEQVDFLAVLLASGHSIDKYLNNYNFDPKEEFDKIEDFA